MSEESDDYFEIYSFVNGYKDISMSGHGGFGPAPTYNANNKSCSIKIDGLGVNPDDIYRKRGYDLFGNSIPPLNEVDEKGSHYKFEYVLSGEDIARGWIRVDPYFVFKLYETGGGPMEHIAKKALRGNHKGHTKIDVYKEIIACAKRGIELEENS